MLKYIECKRCGGLYDIDRIESDKCDWCGAEFSTDEIIHGNNYKKYNSKIRQPEVYNTNVG
jgi:hypothetical protein